MLWKGNINAPPSPLYFFTEIFMTFLKKNSRYGTKFMDEYQAIMTKKLGLSKYNKQLISDLLKNMAVDKVDYTNFFRLLSNVKADLTIQDDELLVTLKAVLLDIGKERKDAWTSWVKSYIQEVCHKYLGFSSFFSFVMLDIDMHKTIYSEEDGKRSVMCMKCGLPQFLDYFRGLNLINNFRVPAAIAIPTEKYYSFP